MGQRFVTFILLLTLVLGMSCKVFSPPESQTPQPSSPSPASDNPKEEPFTNPAEPDNSPPVKDESVVTPHPPADTDEGDGGFGSDAEGQGQDENGQAPIEPKQPTNKEDPIQYKSWKDPLENAFTIDVPDGWAVEGGMTHMSPVQPKASVDVLSPDQAASIRLGDKDTPGYTYSKMILQTGFKEGDLYSPNGIVTYVVAPYSPAKSFVQKAISDRWANDCAGIRLSQSQALPDISTKLTEIESQSDMGVVKTVVDVAEAAFTCTSGGETMNGYLLIKIKSLEYGPESMLWWLDGAYGFLAPVERAPQTWDIMNHMNASYRMNPEWIAGQLEISAEAAKIVTRQSEEMNKILSDRWTQTTCNWGWEWRCTPTPQD